MGASRQRNMAQMKEQIKASEKELSNEEITKLSDAEFKTLVIRKLTELVEFGHKLDEKIHLICDQEIEGYAKRNKRKRTQNQ